ncbi:unnamed protein product [Rhodiola kirilowii]
MLAGDDWTSQEGLRKWTSKSQRSESSKKQIKRPKAQNCEGFNRTKVKYSKKSNQRPKADSLQKAVPRQKKKEIKKAQLNCETRTESRARESYKETI